MTEVLITGKGARMVAEEALRKAEGASWLRVLSGRAFCQYIRDLKTVVR